MFGCQDRDFQLDGEKMPFPETPVPFMVRAIVSLVVARRYAGVWRFKERQWVKVPGTIVGRG